VTPRAITLTHLHETSRDHVATAFVAKGLIAARALM